MAINKSILDTWTHWQKMLFRFFFAYFLLFILFWPTLEVIPGLTKLNDIHKSIIEWIVMGFNTNILHLKKQLITSIGGTDTSFGWAQQILCLILALISTVIWSVFDFKKNNYLLLNSKLKIILRYFIAMIAFGYGIMKIFTIQMSSPTISELSTTIGDTSANQLAWLFFGHSASYQFFLGLVEILIGFLLFFKRTSLLGSFIGFGVFFNVMMLNLCFDIDAKIISINMVFMCSFILFNSIEKTIIYAFFDKVPFESIYTLRYNQFEISPVYSIILKFVFIILFFVIPLITNYQIHKIESIETPLKPISKGIYTVQNYILNKDTIPVLANDTLIWKDLIFENKGLISINTTDTLLNQYKGRGYLKYFSDTIAKTLKCYKYSAKKDIVYLFTIKYLFKDKNNIHFSTKINNDSIHLDMIKSKRRFLLENKKVHWIIENN